MSFYFIARLQMSIRPIPHGIQVNLSVVMPDNVLSSRPRIWSILNQSPHLINVLWSDCLRNGKVHCNRYGDPQLIKLKNGVRSNDSSGTEVHSLSHKVSSQSPFLPSQSRSDCLQSFTRFMLMSWLSLDFIIHQSCNIILQCVSDFIELGSMGSPLDINL